jgi:hypothetical protein
MCVQIRTLRGQDNGFHTLITQVLVECRCECGVPVVNEIPLIQEKAIKWIGELTGTLHHERLIRMGCYSRKVDASCV